MKDLTNGKIIKVILLFAIPLFIGQLFQLFYSLVDTRIVGSVLGDDALASVGSVSTLSDMLLGLLNGFTNGCAIIISIYYGAKDDKNMKTSVAGTFLLGIIFSVTISALCLIFLNPLLDVLNVSDTLRVNARGYISVILGGMLAATLYNVCAAVLRAIGDTITPLIILIISSFLNIGMDILFVKTFSLGVRGAAIATVLAQAISAILCFIYMTRKYPTLRLRREDFTIDHSIYSKMISTGASMAFMIAFVNIGTVALQVTINTFDTPIITAHTGARKATSIFMMPFGILGTTLATYCGQNLGAAKYERIKAGILQTLYITLVWCVIVTIVSYTVGSQLIHLITASTEKEVLDTAAKYLRINTSFYGVPAVICLFRNAMQGFGDSKTPVFSSFLELLGKVLIAFFLAPQIGYIGIIISEPIVWCIMVIPLIVNMLRNPLWKNQAPN